MASKRYHVYRNGRQFGPFSAVRLKQLKNLGELRPDDLLWTPGLSRKVPAGEVAELFPPPPLPAPLPAHRIAYLRADAFRQMARRGARWFFRESALTARAMWLQGGRTAKYLLWKARRASRQPPPLPADGVTRLRAAVGGTILVVLVGFLLAMPGRRPALQQAAPNAVAASEADKPCEVKNAERPEEGRRIAIHTTDNTPARSQRRSPTPARRYAPLVSNTYSRPRVDLEAENARQQAIAQAQYQAERAMRNYRQQTSGYLGSMGLYWTPSSGGSSGYGITYGPSPSASLPPVRPGGNMPSAARWGR